MRNPVYAPTKSFDMNVAISNGVMQRQHYHDTYELFLVLEGSKTLLLDNKKYLLTRGSFFVVEPFVLHMTASDPGTSCRRYIMELSPSSLAPLLTEDERGKLFGGISSRVITLDEDEFLLLHTLFRDAHRHKDLKDSLSAKLMLMSLCRLADFLRSNHGSAEPPLATMRSEEPIMHALAYIEMNYTKPLTLDFISEYAHMSRSNFCLVFKRIVGDTFVNYVNTLRVSHAHRLLITTDLPISAIAAKSGFSSVDYLTRMFKKTHGIAPAKLRKELIVDD